MLANTNSAEADAAAKSGDDFWVKSEKALLSALFAYIILECRPEDQNINSVLELLKIASAREDDEDFVSGLDVLFLELKEKIHRAWLLICTAYLSLQAVKQQKVFLYLSVSD